MTANDLLTTGARLAWELLNPDTWRIAILILVAWGVFLLIQIRGILNRFVAEMQFRSSLPQRDEPTPLDDISLS